MKHGSKFKLVGSRCLIFSLQVWIQISYLRWSRRHDKRCTECSATRFRNNCSLVCEVDSCQYFVLWLAQRLGNIYTISDILNHAYIKLHIMRIWIFDWLLYLVIFIVTSTNSRSSIILLKFQCFFKVINGPIQQSCSNILLWFNGPMKISIVLWRFHQSC